MKYQSLNSILHKEYIKYLLYLTISSIFASILAFLISMHFERVKECKALSERIRDLNDVFAREIIIDSTETFMFELNKIKKDYSLKSIHFDKNQISSNSECSILNLKDEINHPVTFAKKNLGHIITINGSHNLLKLSDLTLFSPLLVIIVFSFIFITSLKRILQNNLIIPISSLLNEAENAGIKNHKFKYDGVVFEFENLKDQLNSMLDRINDINDMNIHLEKKAGIGEIATQVAHDIRSPLASLNMILRDLQNIPENQRLILRTSINRIQDIANSLLKKHREAPTTTNKESDTSSHVISFLVEEIITEKRLQYRSNLSLEINFIMTQNNFGLAANINSVDFRRIISNLIDNSVEAIGNNPGTIEISILPSSNNHIILKIIDNGKGLKEEQILLLGKDQISFGKQDGNGLGVFHAAKTIAKWGGSLEYSTNYPRGIEAKITLEKSMPPEWLPSHLNLSNISNIVILDDDADVHNIWARKFQSFPNTFLIMNMTSTQELHEYCESKVINDTLFLIDFEIIGSQQTGLDTINALQIQTQSILVTSRYDESSVIERATQLNVKIIPKNLVEFIPLEISRPREIVLIDDDKLIRSSWINKANAQNIKITTFGSIDDFLLNADNIPLNAYLYIDSHLGQNIKGEIEAARISQKGFLNLYICTGYEDISLPPYIKGKIGKQFPY